ncbi:MAG: fluoride efflux transporter CrcB [Desulfamplus sp.]|nr:fluoride efflux transporter CrcB [Desulfamplus sp.]
MLKIILVGMGGFMGAILRFWLGTYIQNRNPILDFPLGTLIVNLSGCMAIGMLSRMDEIKELLSPEIRMFLFMGFLGAFTTFSTFGNETIQLFHAKRVDFALLNVIIHVVVGLSSILIGRFIINIILK